ncbi:MAG: acyl-CoA synthetase [Deltaproteobacteria bacterium]|nr:acyl-CoA synthetase [Deltaproteobacteria bacterium]MCB9489884.1 acyl-CoA synthetase [Deltaproteobacteria bacterium]
MRLNIAQHCLLRHARDASRADKTALIFTAEDGREQTFTYRQLAEHVDALAGALLRRGLTPGDRVLIRLPNCAAYAVAFFGAMRAGLIPVPSSAMLTAEEVDFLLRDAGARAIIGSPELLSPLWETLVRPPELCLAVVDGEDESLLPSGLERADFRAMLDETGAVNLPDVGDEDPAYLIYTSGTTDHPKGVLHAHRSLMGRATVVREWEGLVEDDRVCHAGALNWTYTLGVGLMDPWSVGATAILYAGQKDPAVWPGLIERHRVTVFAAVPTVYRQILKYADVESFDLSSLRHGLTAGEALPVGVYDEWKRRAGCELYEALGMTEISTYISFKPGMTVKPGACGVPQAGRPIRLIGRDDLHEVPPGEVGRIAVRRDDPGLMLRYWNRAEEELGHFEGEWFVGGDLARAAEDGVWWYQGRDDDVMTSFGYRVSPQEVEHILATHPTVAECAVTMVPTGREGIAVMTAFVKLADGATFNDEGLSTHCHAHLADYKCPKAFRQVDALPRTRNGKVKRAELLKIAD